MGAGAISAGVVKRSGKNWGRTHWGRTISREPLGGSPSGATSTTIYLGHSFFLSGASGTTLPYPLSPITLLPSYSPICTPVSPVLSPGRKCKNNILNQNYLGYSTLGLQIATNTGLILTSGPTSI